MIFFNSIKNSTNQFLESIDGHMVTIKREDLIHPLISGNKFRKLKYNIKKLTYKKNPVLLTFGGAFSNHLAATAQVGEIYKIPTIGIVRGEEWADKIQKSYTLDLCQKQGMKLFCTSRNVYLEKEKGDLVQKLQFQHKNLIILPEGGTNEQAVKGCKEILGKKDTKFDTICCSVGTGGTLAGIIKSSRSNQFVLGFNALNNPCVDNSILEFTQKKNWNVISDFTFGGYAKVSPKLITFMNDFYQQYDIPLDPIYNGKMLFGIFDLIKKKQWCWGKNILVIHSGGLQGIKPMNLLLRKRKLPILNYGNL